VADAAGQQQSLLQSPRPWTHHIAILSDSWMLHWHSMIQLTIYP